MIESPSSAMRGVGLLDEATFHAVAFDRPSPWELDGKSASGLKAALALRR